MSLVVGAGLLGVGMLAGYLFGRRAQKSHPDPEPVCGCGHHRALHDPEALTCSSLVEIQLRNDSNYLAGTDWRPCVCRQYVGPEPISSLWSPPVLPEGSGR